MRPWHERASLRFCLQLCSIWAWNWILSPLHFSHFDQTASNSGKHGGYQHRRHEKSSEIIRFHLFGMGFRHAYGNVRGHFKTALGFTSQVEYYYSALTMKLCGMLEIQWSVFRLLLLLLRSFTLCLVMMRNECKNTSWHKIIRLMLLKANSQAQWIAS